MAFKEFGSSPAYLVENPIRAMRPLAPARKTLLPSRALWTTLNPCRLICFQVCPPLVDTPVPVEALATATDQPVYRITAKLRAMADEF